MRNPPALLRTWSVLAVGVTLAACSSTSDNTPLGAGGNGSGGTVSDVDAGPGGSGGGGMSTEDGGAGAGEAGVQVGNAATPTLPAPTGKCPTFANGDVTFAPAGMPARHAQVYMTDAAKTKHGPLVFYWYATGSSTSEASYSLGSTLASIQAAGGIVVVPQADPTAGMFEWFIVNQSPKLDDFLLADEIVGCAAKSTMVDTTHIHAMGMSAGALQTTAMSFMRSSYVASVATYSGGMPPGFMPTVQDPANKFAALIFDGGTSDNVFNTDFKAASETYRTTLQSTGHFTAICDHGKGHDIPLDAAPSVAKFFQDNGFGAPAPYKGTLPASFPTYCKL